MEYTGKRMKEKRGKKAETSGQESTEEKPRTKSPQHNTESKDYSVKDIEDRREKYAEQAHIIADPFKPTMNKWMHEDQSSKNKHQ